MLAERNTGAQVATEPPPGNIDDNAADAAARREREARSEALEKTYVHDVYRQMAGRLCEMRRRPWPRVKQFLSELEPGSLVCDVGCGDGRYLSLNADAYFVGVDRCARLAEAAATAAGAGAAHTRHQVVVCDALGLPLRDASVDAAVSVAVIHHLATTERRVRALRELARVLRIGGRLIVTVWALEQRTRKFESQDVLVPWNQPSTGGSGEDQTSAGEPEAISTTSDDDLLNYSAFTQTSDSDSSRSTRFQVRRSGRRPRRIRSIDPTLVSSSQSSSGLSSPSESCYSFVRRALQKLARRGEVDGSRPWILLPWTSYTEAKQTGAKSGEAAADGQLIEIRLDDDTASLEETPRRRNTLGCDQPSQAAAGQPLGAFKSRSVGDMWSLLSASVLAARRPQSKRGVEQGMAPNPASDRPRSFAFDESTSVEMGRSQSSVSALWHQQTARKGSRKSVTFSTQSLTLPRERQPLTVIGEKSKSDSVLDGHGRPCELMRVSLTTVPENEARDCDDNDTPSAKPALVRQQRLTEEPAAAAPSRVHSEEGPPTARRPARGILKQTSLNENLMRRDWASERAEIRGRIRKQQSLNENVIYGKLAGAQQPAAVSSFASYSRLRALRDNLGKLSESLEKRAEKDVPAAGSLKNGLVKIVRQLTEGAVAHNDVIVVRETPNSHESGQRGGDQAKQTAPPPAKAGSSCSDVGKQGVPNCADEQCERVAPMSEPAMKSTCPAPTSPFSHTRADRRSIYRHCSRERKTSREESSDSSKENSFQSDTSLDSEDSCVSVIYVPKVSADADSRQRSRSASSESSDGSNGKLSPKSPLTLSLPLSPTRLAASPTRLGTGKGGVTLGAQVLQSNLQGRFQLMDPPAGTGAGGSVGACAGTFKTASTPATAEVPPDLKAVATASPSQAARLPASSRVTLQKQELNVPKDVSSSDCAISQTQTPEECAQICQDKESVPVKLKRSPEEEASARRVPLPDVVPCGTSSRAHLSTTSALASASASPPSPAPSKACDSTSFHFQPGSGATSAPCPTASRPAGVSSQVSSLIMGENIEIIRRPGVQGLRSVQILRRPAPKYLTFEVFNPETDDLDSESSCASSSSSEASSPSSPSSACSVVSLAADWPSARELRQLDNDIEQQQQQQQQQDGRGDQPLSTPTAGPSVGPTGGASHLAAPCETDDSLSSSPEPPARLSSPRGRRKTTLARLELPPLEQVLEEVEPPRASLLSNLPTSERRLGTRTQLSDLEAAGDSAHCPLLAPPDAEPARVPPGATLTASAIFDQAEAAAATEAADKEGAASSEESAAWTQGGALGHHRYYHVFREGELDRLIEKYVDNLHIISSYYDHANWCVIAEKVQVWTI